MDPCHLNESIRKAGMNWNLRRIRISTAYAYAYGYEYHYRYGTTGFCTVAPYRTQVLQLVSYLTGIYPPPP